MIEVKREAEDRLSAKIWWFTTHSGHLVLRSYMDGSRATTRHKYRGKAWSNCDERSASLPRPTDIPDDVIDEAILHIKIDVYIGWSAMKYKIAERAIVAAKGKMKNV
jgi:hypothetical protein